MRIAVLGVHASGKTTIARLLSEHLGVPYVSTDPIEIVRLFKFHERTWPIVSQEVFTYISYSLTRAVFNKYRSFITDYDPVLQLAYITDDEERKRVRTLLAQLDKYDIVIVLHVHNPLTVVDRALTRFRWGQVMLTAWWQTRYLKFTERVLAQFNTIVNLVCGRGRMCVQVNTECKDVEQVLQEILRILDSTLKSL